MSYMRKALKTLITQRMKETENIPQSDDLFDRLRIESPRPDAGHTAEKAYERLSQRIHSEEKTLLISTRNHTRKYRIWLAAASVCVAVLAAGWAGSALKPETEMLVRNNNWEKVSDMTLDDGTRLTLNRGAQLIYPEHFTGRQREIFLSGEAYFEVAHDAGHPFVVRVGDLKIKVLGTKFNVEAYPDSEIITTTLLEGSVEVESQLNHHRLRLAPDQQLTYDTRSGEMHLSTLPESEESIRWTDNVWILHQTPFMQMCKRMEHLFNIKIIILNDTLADKKFTGEFHYGDSLESILEIIRITTPFDYERKGDVLILK